METKDIILQLRTQMGLSQDALAEKIYVTRQAVSRWENGETIPNVEALKLLSQVFDVSINTLLGSPRQLVCQCCGMPLEDATTSREPNGAFNEEYCKWCYAGGEFRYTSKEQLIDFLSYYEPGEDVELTLEVPDGKGYKEETVTVTLGENTNTQSTGSEDNGDGQGSSQDDNLLEDWENNEGGSGLQYGEGWN